MDHLQEFMILIFKFSSYTLNSFINKNEFYMLLYENYFLRELNFKNFARFGPSGKNYSTVKLPI